MTINKKIADMNSVKRSVRSAKEFCNLSLQFLSLSNRGLPRADFFRQLLIALLEFSGCDEVELRIKEGLRMYRCRIKGREKRDFSLEVHQNIAGLYFVQGESGEIEDLCRQISGEDFQAGEVKVMVPGIFISGDIQLYLEREKPLTNKKSPKGIYNSGGLKSISIVRIEFNGETVGLLLMKSQKEDFFLAEESEWYEEISKIIGIAINHRQMQVMLRERVKELTCLYGIAQVAASPDLTLSTKLQNIVELLPPGWLFPKIARGRIIIGGKAYLSPDFKEGVSGLSADILVNNEPYGQVEVVYVEERPVLDEGPFLKEERSLINAVSREIGIMIERNLVEEEKERLRQQLLHADRLATIGILAAGVAHELNEPLGNILGFAQLSQKYEGLQEQVQSDLQKIVNSSLHAREIIKKLLIFARQSPTRMTTVNLNQVVNDCLSFFEHRFPKEGIELKRSQQPNLPDLTADPSQLNQVLVNLIVNAMQAMPNGGTLLVLTFNDEKNVYLVVEDSGVGMEEGVLKRIFLPFFTTKHRDQGTGLGLAVVHGIITSHNGSIKVESKVGQGSRFEIKLPISGEKVDNNVFPSAGGDVNEE